MSLSIKILIVDRQEDTRTTLSNLLKETGGIDVQTEEILGERLFETITQFQPDLIIINLAPDENQGLELAEKIKKQYDQLVIIVTAPKMQPDIIRRAMRSGAREFLSQPFTREEIDNVIQAAVQFKSEIFRKPPKAGEVITLVGAKGGIGTTTLATNLAVALARRSGKKIILLDLHLQLGHDALFLNLKSKYSIIDVVNHLDGIDVQVLLKTLPKHDSGAYLLPSPFKIEEADFITSDQIARLLALLREHFDYVLIDTHAYFDEITIKALDEADKIILISSLDLSAIFNSKRCLELFLKMGYQSDKILLVLNRYAAYAGADLDEMEKLLEFLIFGRIPAHDFASMLNCINQGVPIVVKTPGAKISEAIFQIAEKLLHAEGEENGKAVKGGIFSKLTKK